MIVGKVCHVRLFFVFPFEIGFFKFLLNHIAVMETVLLMSKEVEQLKLCTFMRSIQIPTSLTVSFNWFKAKSRLML